MEKVKRTRKVYSKEFKREAVALGELSAGVAHELNQPLTGVMGFSQELLSMLKEQDGDKKLINYGIEIEKNAVRMNKIIKQLREFTRKNTEDIKKSNVSDIIRESLKLLEAQFKSRGIDVVIKEGKNVPHIYCNPFQLEQVFINLATNARDAIESKSEGSGKITIEIKWEKNDQFVEVHFKDNGSGMNQETKLRAMDPFYTTKEVGKGTGLGLSVSFGILSQIHASLFIESEQGKGSTTWRTY